MKGRSRMADANEIDGSVGEGGGQVLRTALSLAAITGREVLFSNIRAKREKPGLKPSPLTSVPLTTKKAKCGKIGGMRKRTADAMIGLVLSIFTATAFCVASDVSANAFRGGGHPRQSRVEASCAPHSARPDAFPEAARAEVRGRVAKVADGDTIKILSQVGPSPRADRESISVGSRVPRDRSVQYKIRFHGIDAHEKLQAFGKAADKYLASLIAGREVTAKVQDVDQYGRTVGKVFVDGLDINLKMFNVNVAPALVMLVSSQKGVIHDNNSCICRGACHAIIEDTSELQT